MCLEEVLNRMDQMIKNMNNTVSDLDKQIKEIELQRCYNCMKTIKQSDKNE